MKIVIVGGHLAPALAVIEALPNNTDILYIGRKNALEGDRADSLEYRKITALNIPFENLATGRFQRKFTKHTIPSLLKLPRGLFKALIILRKYKPDVVMCFGGYVQIPVAFAAFLLKIPVITHEQTLKAGLANKIISSVASAICISWKESEKYFPKDKTVLTGIPIRKEFVVAKSRPFNKEGAKRIYITGGNLGSHGINLLVEGCLEKLLEKFHVTHQTGDARQFNDFERLEKTKSGLPADLQKKYTLEKFIDPEEVAFIMVKADLVISRSGMNTITELIFLEKPCILIPLPHGQTNEQLTNALFVEKIGLGKVLRQSELTSEILYSQIVEFIDKMKDVSKLGLDVHKIINNDAAEKIVKIITEKAKQKKQ